MIAARYLRKWFELSFTNYVPEWIDSALEGFGEGRALFFTDLGCVHPSVAEAGEFNRDILNLVETDTTLEAVFLYRLARSIFLREPKHPSLRYFAHLMKTKTATEIYYSTEIGPRFRIEHGFGVVIGPRNRIGSDFIVHQEVTLGQRRMFSPHETMTIGNHCIIGAGAKVLGTVTLGDHVTIAANAVLLTDAESHATYAGIPAIKVRGKAAS
jgi:serine O-acetyltransferase